MAAPSPISLNFLPRSLRKALLNFQKEGVRFGISKQGRCLIGDEMGLGKTLQAISIAYYYKDAWPLLIVAPSSVKFSWIEEIEKWLPEVEPHNINLIRSGSDISNLGKAIIHVIGYGLLSVGTSKLLTEALESYKFSVVILDESHYLKTRKAARTKRLHQLCKKAKHAILLSGTPSLARPRELYFQLDIVCPGKFGSFNSFVKRYCDAHSVYYRGERRYDTSGASNLSELYNLLRMHVMIRRLKKEVLTQLPPKRRQKVTFDISESSSKYKKELQHIMKDFKKCSAILKGLADDPSIQSPLFEMNRLSTLLYHYTGLVKIGPVLKYIEDLAQGMDSKFIVFFRHRLVRQAIVQKLVTLKIKHICIAGDVASSIRGDLVHSFQTDPQVRIAVLSIEAASFGLTLTAAHHVVFAELHHTPGVIIQAEDRAHRIGQTLPVNVHYLIARGTVDEILWGMIRRKVYVTSSTLDGVCQELQAEDGDEDQGRQLSACAAWVQDQEEDTDELEEFVMEQIATKTKQDHAQRDLRSFFTPSPRASSSQSNCSLKKQRVSLGILDVKTRMEVVSVLDSDEDDDELYAWDDIEDDDALMSVSLKVPEKVIEEFKPAADTPQDSGISNAKRKPVTGATEMLRDNRNVDTGRKPVTNATEMLRDNRNVDTGRKPVTGATEMLRDNRNVDTERKPVTNATEMLRDNRNVDAERKHVTNATEMFQDDSDVDVERKHATQNAETLQNNRQLNVERKPATLSVDENCLMKPKMLKFKKEKDGKLTFARSKIHTKTRKKETECKVSPLEIVGNDPDSESQTLQSYLDDECERGRITKAEMQHGDMEKIGCNTDDCKPRDRGFFASLQDADVECVAVVCKKTSSRTAQSNDLFSGDDAPVGAIQRDENDAFDNEKLDSKQDVSEEEARDVLEENARVLGSTTDSAPSLLVASPTCKLKSEPEQVQIRVSTEDSCTVHGDLTESDIQTESLPDGAATEQVDGPDSHPSGNKTVEHFSTEGTCSYLNRCENGIDVDTASSLLFTKVKGLSKGNEFPHSSCNNVIVTLNEDVDYSTKRLRERPDEKFHSSKDMAENKSVQRSSNSLTCLQQLSEAASSKIESGEKRGDRRSVLIDEDSSDDFEVSHVQHTQPTRPRLTQMPPRKNKRNGNKKSKTNEMKFPKRRCYKKNQLPPSWSCSACTFLNDGQLLECSICFTPRVTTAKGESQISDNVDCKDSITVNNDFKVVEATRLSANIKSSDVAGTQLQNRLSSGEMVPEGDGSKGAEVLPGSVEVYGFSSVSEQRAACKDTCKTSICKGGEGGLPPWSCSVCTFSNMSELIECSMCLTPRRRSQRLSARKLSPKVIENKSKSSRKRRYKRDTVKKNEIQRADFSCNLKRVDDNNSKFTVINGKLESDGKGLTAEPMESFHCASKAEVGGGDENLAPEPMESSHCASEAAVGDGDERSTPEPMESSHGVVLAAGGRGDDSLTPESMESSHCAGEAAVGRGDESLTPEPMQSSHCTGEAAVDSGDKVLTLGSMESSHCDPDAPLESNDEGLTPEPMETLNGNPDDGYNCVSKENLTILKDNCNSVKPRPRKRLKLEEHENVNTPDDKADFFGISSVSGSSPLACAIQKYSKETILSDGKQTASSADCVASKDVGKVEKAQHIPHLLDKNNCDNQCDLLKPSDHSIKNSKTASTNPSFETAEVEEANSRLHVREETHCQLEENLDELKAAAEEIFISEWEDDEDSWWEEGSSSEQSSYPSSCDTTSSSQSLTTNSNTGFAKCSDLYSLSELKNRLQSGSEQSKARTSDTADAGNAPPPELSPDHKMMAVPLPEEKCAPAVEEEEIYEPEEIPEPLELKFCLSFYTERVYLYIEDNKPLGINFCMSDVVNGNTEDLPNVLHHDYNLKQVKRFLGAWKRMGEGKKRVLRKSALVFGDPLEAYERARKGATRESSYARHPSKETQIQKVMDTAEEIGGNVRLIKKPRMRTKKTNNRTGNCQGTNDGQSLATSTSSSSTLSTNPALETTSTTCYQVVRADGIPLCLFCSGPVEFAERLKCSDWDKRFCSHDCKKEYQVRVSGTAARRALFEAERGVCQLCSLDAHSLYLCVTALHVRDRPAYLAQTPYASLPQQILKKMVIEPKEGMFWEADHIIPVSEGGGECGLDNYRTLCVMCHRKETGALNKRLKQHKALQHAAGYADISTFFRPPN